MSKIKGFKKEKYNRLTPIRATDRRDNFDNVIWECRCDCGNTHYASYNNILTGAIKSCGCLKKEKTSENMKKGFQKHAKMHLIDGTNIARISLDRPSKNNTSGVTGVYSERGKWRALITFKGKQYDLGRHEKFEDAVNARRKKEEELFLDFLKSHGYANKEGK